MNKSILDRMTDKWLLVVSEYEKVKRGDKSKFKTVNEICSTYKVHRKDIRKYYERWKKSGGEKESLLPQKRGPKPGQLRILSKEEERQIVKIQRRFGSSEFELYEMIGQVRNRSGTRNFKVHPSVSTIYRTFKRYPLNKKRKEKIKRYEKKYPGEMLHGDTHSLAKTLVIERKRYYLFGMIDDCTRLCYVELIERQTAAAISE
ncbi:hypothetical protein KJ918_01050, partial [Patescibacteria group bacterium]|nr:hypothetical protein [Patescibacteria group bacterium]